MKWELGQLLTFHQAELISHWANSPQLEVLDSHICYLFAFLLHIWAKEGKGKFIPFFNARLYYNKEKFHTKLI